MNILIDAKSLRIGGGLTYLKNILPEFKQSFVDAGNRVAVLRPAEVANGFAWPEGFDYRDYDLGRSVKVSGTDTSSPSRVMGRLWYDQVTLPRMLRADRSDALFSSANFGTLRPPCRQVILVRNTIYFDHRFLQRMRPKVRAFLGLQRYLVLKSIQRHPRRHPRRAFSHGNGCRDSCVKTASSRPALMVSPQSLSGPSRSSTSP